MEIISILEFFKTGKFGDVELNFSKSKTISLIGKNIKYNICMNGEILKYQDIEFHFFGDVLFMIFCDSLKFAYEDLSVGEGINFDNWIFKKAKRFSFAQMKQELKKENIAFITKEKKDRIDIILESGVKLIFENDNNSELKLDDYILIGFEFSNFNL